MRSSLKLASTSLFSLALALAIIATAARESQAVVLFCAAFPCPAVACGIWPFNGTCTNFAVFNANTGVWTVWCSCV